MEEQFKEIEGLLETTQTQIHQTPTAKFKKYCRLVFPHVALVTVVCIYAMIGAYIFYRLESPNEDRLKTIGRSSILDMRSHLISIIREGELSKDDWKDQIENELLRFNDKIYNSFKEQYVRYADVRLAALPDSSEEKDDDRVKRHRGSKSRSEKGEKLWTASSALFFAATTMATIGYGNIVPATSSGRIACVVFALFGAPLAIITIGDLGKFLSECTIWLYKQMKKGKVSLRTRWKEMRGTGKCNLDDCEEQSEESGGKSQLDWEDLVMDKTEVPVLMVFTILLLYIAFGGILFSFLEGWTYMDAFYYSFISLTTIGFGDIVPENHDYIVLMLIYLGVGLAVTTMCIDLVGIQYIQKIHYFGRKFRGTDILHLLKRRRMIERRLAMGHGDEILQMYIQQIQKEMEEPDESEDEDVPEEMEPLKELSLKAPSPDWQIDDALVSSRYSYKFPCSERIPSPNVLSIRSFRNPSIYTNSSASARSMMMARYHSRGGSWDESGPSLSDHCSLSTEPSVHQRQDYWDNYTSPQPSITSFKFEFPPPSPDYHAIAADARRSRRLCSCPNSSFSFPSHSNSPVGLACMEDWDSYIRMLEEYDKPYERWGSPMVETISEVSDEEEEETLLRYSIPSPDDLPSPHTPSIYSIASPPPSLESPGYTSSSPSIPSPMSISPQTPSPMEFPSPVSPISPPREPIPLSPPPEEPIPGPSSVPLIMPPVISTPMPRTPSEPSTSPPPEPTPPQVQIFVPHQVAAPLDEMESSMLSSPFIPAWTAMQTPVLSMPSTSSPIPTIVRAEVPLTQVLLELEKQKELTIQEQIIPEYNVEAISSLVAESSSEDEAPGGYDLDLGAFELVDSGLTPETLLNTEEPVIFHEDMPVHSVHHDTVQTEAALANLMSAPSSMLTGGIPPIMVEDNYCFVVDGERVRMGDILGDDQWWRHTSRPTKYFYSEDLRQFHRVNCITAKGKVITAKLATPSSLQVQSGVHHAAHPHLPSASSSSTPRSSVSGSSSNRPSHHNANKVPLNHVYKVIRFYSFWKTCTSFHRIVTMIDKVSGDERTANPDFKKRLFVQYLWRNAKAVDKVRVQKEFDPRRQRLLRFVTDPAARKRFQKM